MLSCSAGIPKAPLSIDHDNEVTHGLRDAILYINGEEITNYQLINGKTIEINLVLISKKNTDLDLEQKLEAGETIEIRVKYIETIDVIQEENWNHILLGFGSNFQSSNTTLYFCLPKLPLFSRLISFLDITQKKFYEIIGFPYRQIRIHQTKLKKIKKSHKLPTSFLQSNDKKKSYTIAHFTESEKYIERLQFFSFWLPKISYKKAFLRIITFILTLFVGGYIAQVFFSGSG